MTAPDAVAAPPSVGVVVLSQGTRPTELARCLNSLRGQTGVLMDVVVVGNGWAPTDLGAAVAGHALVENLGAAGGRNIGARQATGDLLFFFDDDAWTEDPELLRRAAELFAERSKLGALQLRVRDPDGVTMRRWVPRGRKGDPGKSGPAFSLAEGVTIVRRSAFDAVGGWPDAFFFGHEGIDLAWRMWDGGWELYYAAHLVVRHPATLASRHANFFRLTARNRVWVARRNLPWPLVPMYLTTWTVVTQFRLARHPRELVTWWRGFVEGWRTDPGPRHAMSWRTVAHLARLGQPPIF